MAAKHEPPLVLVADDDPQISVMLRRIFEREGYEVENVDNGITALEYAARLLPDLIILDVRMPQMSGFDVLRQLRENAVTASIPTIIVTAKAREPTDLAHGLGLGADDYLYKPFDLRELLARAQSKMKARQLEDALHRRTQELEALLRISEELNQYLEVNELLDLILYLMLDLLPGDIAAVYRFDKNSVATQRTRAKDQSIKVPELGSPALIKKILKVDRIAMWPGEAAGNDNDSPISQPLVANFASGMIVPMRHGDQRLGALMLLDHVVPYDRSHLRLFEGVGRQAALALRNAELYEIQATYALHLEDMVTERTAELQSAQQMLIRSEKLASIGELAASLAHEINNPLQPTRIILENMLEDVKDQKLIDVLDVETMQGSIDRISRIVSQLLEFTGRRSSGPDVQLLDLNTLLEGVLNLNRKYFERERVIITADLEAIPEIYGSRDQLEQVFLNMTLNAVAAMEKGGSLRVSTRVEGNAIVVKFADTGCGIPPEELDRIFDPFFSTKSNGTGLGLFVSYGIIQSHHGTIEVTSKVNKGTTFTVRLPITATPATQT